MPDVQMGNQLAPAVVHVLPTWGGGRETEGLKRGDFHKGLRRSPCGRHCAGC